MASRLSRVRRSVAVFIAGAAGLPQRVIRLGGVPGLGIGAYEAGKLSRRDPDFTPRSLGPNALAEVGNLERVVARARDLFDNNPLIDGGVQAIVDKVVGCGIGSEADTGDAEFNAQVDELVEWASRRVDPERQLSLPESQRLFLQEVINAGECGVHHAMARDFANVHGRWPTMPAIELIDRERIPLDLNGLAGGNQVRQGIEYEPKHLGGRTVAYHVLTMHPTDGEGFGGLGGLGSWGIGSPNVMRIPVDRMELAFRSRRVAQLRGVPWTVSAMSVLRMEDGYQDDCMLQARTATGFGVIFKMKGALDLFRRKRDNKLNLAVNGEGEPVQRMEAGSITFVNGDTSDPVVVNPNLPGPQFEPTIAALQRRGSRSLRLPYSTYSGDASRTTFSSMRGEQLDARSGFKPNARWVYEHHTEAWRRAVLDWGLLTRPAGAERRASRADRPQPGSRAVPVHTAIPRVRVRQPSAGSGRERNGYPQRRAVCAGRDR
jgi:capsid protein